MPSSSLKSDTRDLMFQEPADIIALLDQFPVGIILVDSQARVTGWNASACRMFDFEVQDVLGKTLPVIPPEGQENFNHLLQRVLSGDIVNEMELEWRDAEGNRVPVNVALAALHFGVEEPQNMVLVVSDITERKWARATLEGTARRLSMVNRMGRSVLSDLELWKVLHNIIDQLLPMIPGTRRMAVLLRDENAYRFAALGGDAPDHLMDARMSLSNEQREEIPHSSTLVKLPVDFLRDTPSFNQPEGVLYGVPLRAKEKYLGLMVFLAPEETVLSDELQALVGEAANWASIAILNANQHQELQRQLQESQALMSISQALSETLEIDRIFEIIAQNAQNIIPESDLVAIHYLDSEAGGLAHMASSTSQSADPKCLLEYSSQSFIDRITHAEEPVYVPDIRKETFLNEDLDDVMVSLLAVSIMGEKGPFGIISVQSQKANAFSSADIRLLKQLRVEAALALQNASLYQNERTQRQWAEILSQVGTLLTSSVDLDVVLNTILEQISLIIPLSSVHIILIENDQVVNVRELQSETAPIGHKMPNSLLEIKNIREIMETGEPLVIPDTSDSPKWEYMPQNAWIKSYMGIPLKYGEKTIGLININSVKPDSFSGGMIHILKSLAAYATIAVQNARLVRDLQESLEQEKQMREQLIQSDRLAAMGRMAASIAHEINNPLQGILGCLELAHVSMGDPDRQKKYLDLASSALESLNEIVERILSFQRPLQGTMEHTDARNLIEEVLALSNKKIEQENITIVLKLDRKMPKVYGIPGQLKQVFLNLTLNAVEAMDPGGVLTISSKKVVMEEPWLQISFSDTGKGISEEELQRLFEPFYSTKTNGTGLGLWVSQNIIDSHRGRITSESKLDEGTTFTVWLPLNPPRD
jgi:PAS domain S-box-containing protein